MPRTYTVRAIDTDALIVATNDRDEAARAFADAMHRPAGVGLVAVAHAEATGRCDGQIVDENAARYDGAIRPYVTVADADDLPTIYRERTGGGIVYVIERNAPDRSDSCAGDANRRAGLDVRVAHHPDGPRFRTSQAILDRDYTPLGRWQDDSGDDPTPAPTDPTPSPSRDARMSATMHAIRLLARRAVADGVAESSDVVGDCARWDVFDADPGDVRQAIATLIRDFADQLDLDATDVAHDLAADVEALETADRTAQVEASAHPLPHSRPDFAAVLEDKGAMPDAYGDGHTVDGVVVTCAGVRYEGIVRAPAGIDLGDPRDADRVPDRVWTVDGDRLYAKDAIDALDAFVDHMFAQRDAFDAADRRMGG